MKSISVNGMLFFILKTKKGGIIMEFCIQFTTSELQAIGNILSKQYTINMNTLKKYSSYASDNFTAIAEETELLSSLIKKIESYGHYFLKK